METSPTIMCKILKFIDIWFDSHPVWVQSNVFKATSTPTCFTELSNIQSMRESASLNSYNLHTWMHHRLNNSRIGLCSVFGHDVSVCASMSEQLVVKVEVCFCVFVWKDHVKAVKICRSVSSFPNWSWTRRIRSGVALEMLNPICTRSFRSNRNPSLLMFSS